MASPQKENGYTPVANELVEALVREPLSGGQLRLMLCLMRETYGWNRSTVRMSGSRFGAATGLHPKVVARELRDLEAKGLVAVERQEGRISEYRIQKDYERWATGNQNAPGTGNQNAPGAEPNSSRYREPNSSRSIYRGTKEKESNTEPNGSAAGAASGGTLKDRYSAEYQRASNKVAVLGELFSIVLGAEPNHGRLGKMAKRLNSGGKLMDLIIAASQQRITDDPHDYLEAMVKRELDPTQRKGYRPTQADFNSAKKAAEEKRAVV